MRPSTATWQRTRWETRRAAGLCPRCGGERDRTDRTTCAACRAASTDYERRRNDREPAAARRRYATAAEKRRAYRQRFRHAALEHYGGRCACCGETNPSFLAIDHINNDGAAHRRIVGSEVARWLRKAGYPAGFQVLCHNCNMAKQFYGSCPHQAAPSPAPE